MMCVFFMHRPQSNVGSLITPSKPPDDLKLVKRSSLGERYEHVSTVSKTCYSTLFQIHKEKDHFKKQHHEVIKTNRPLIQAIVFSKRLNESYLDGCGYKRH